MAKENILVFCAHDDDIIIGGGGTLLKYIQQGKNIIIAIFSAGQHSHPHLKEKIVVKTREKEATELKEKFGIKDIIFFRLKDTKIKEEIDENVKQKIITLIKKYKPLRIFVPSSKDPHIDHRAVNNIITEILNESKLKTELFAFEVWNILTEDHPYIYEDITPYYKEKLEMMKIFKSQRLSLFSLLLPMYFRAKRYGKKINVKYAEKFYKLK